MARRAIVPLLLLTLVPVQSPAQSAPPKFASLPLRELRYDQLVDQVLDRQGRVILVNFWASYCLPCKREFPRLVQTENRFRDRGLVILTVSLDDPDNPQAGSAIRQFLAGQRAEMIHFWLKEKPEVWQSKLKIDGPPCVFLFDSRGRLVKKYHDHVDFDDIDRRLEKLLR